MDGTTLVHQLSHFAVSSVHKTFHTIKRNQTKLVVAQSLSSVPKEINKGWKLTSGNLPLKNSTIEVWDASWESSWRSFWFCWKVLQLKTHWICSRGKKHHMCSLCGTSFALLHTFENSHKIDSRWLTISTFTDFKRKSDCKPKVLRRMNLTVERNIYACD